jgi:hypothetical protein
MSSAPRAPEAAPAPQAAPPSTTNVETSNNNNNNNNNNNEKGWKVLSLVENETSGL